MLTFPTQNDVMVNVNKQYSVIICTLLLTIRYDVTGYDVIPTLLIQLPMVHVYSL